MKADSQQRYGSCAHRARFRFYEELNDFLPKRQRKVEFEVSFRGLPAVKDVIESLGVPHAEVDLILVNSISVDFSHRLNSGDRVSVYPMFESLDIGNVTRLCAKPLRNPTFILDVHLGTLARKLRLLGFDSLYSNTYGDVEIATTARNEKRAILTRDVGLLKIGIVTHGYWVRSTRPREQVREVLDRFDLRRACKPFSRCIACNGMMAAVDKAQVLARLEEKTKKYYDRFSRCESCSRVFWEGSHYERMVDEVRSILGADTPLDGEG